MIYCDHHIRKAIAEGRLIIDPQPDISQYDSSSVNLRVGHEFRVWSKSLLGVPGTAHSIELDKIDLAEISGFTELLEPNKDGLVVIPPGGFALVLTLEYVELPIKSKLAGRVEGRSKPARLGMTAHISAPTIHAGFGGKIALEILNHGPFRLELRPNYSQVCQLIIEEVSGIPKKGGSATFSQQATPLGTPKRRRR